MQGAFEAVERSGGSGWTTGGWIARGWAFDAEAPDAPVRLLLRCEDGVLGEFLADRRGVGADGSGRWDFALRLPDRLTDGRPHWLAVLAAKDGRELPRRADALFHPSPFLGRLDGVVDGTLHGWAIDERAPRQPVVVTVTIDGARAGMVSGDLKRPDLAAALGSDGRHGFCFPLPAALFDGRPHRVSAHIANTDRTLEGGPLEVRLSPALLTARRRALDQRQARHRGALEDGRLALAREPLNHLADPAAYARWLAAHEAMIGARVAAVACGGADIRAHPVPAGMDAGGFAAAVAASGGDAVVLLDPGAWLHPAFPSLAGEAMAGGAEIVYCDDDAQDEDGRRHSPRFKPGWDPDRYRSFPYTGRACAIRHHRLMEASAVVARRERPADAVAWAAAVVDTALLTVAPERVRHLPFVLHHGPATAEEPALPGRAERVRMCLDGDGVRADVRTDAAGRLRVRWPLPDPAPAVTLIIPTRDQGHLLKACLDSVRATVRHRHADIVVVDNDSRDPATLALLDRLAGEPGLRVRRWPGAFNYAALHNEVIEELRSPYVLLLNNDVEAIEPGWLEEMMGHAVRPEVGAVGAKLLYPDGMIQHGGVIVGQQGGAGHAWTAFRDGEDGHLHGAMIVQGVSAVTAACMLCRREDYLAVGGMDADHLPVAFNDVDLCLKLRALGRRIVWTPHARLHHRESATRKALVTPDAAARELREVEWLRAAWGMDRFADPFHSPNLSLGPLSHVDFRWPEPRRH